MTRILLLLTAIYWNLFATEPKSITGTLTYVKEQKATIDVGPVAKGVSGIVIHAFDRTHQAIIATAIVTASERGKTTLSLKPYNGLPQPNLPNIKTKPQKGDRVILGYLYDRILPIAPNKKSFDLAKEHFPKLRIIHPDLVATELAKEKEPIPTREILQRTCDKFNLGIVMIMLSNGTDFLDCQSWQKVAHADVTALDVKHFKQPFFHRFEEIPSAIYDWGDKSIDDYDTFYAKLEKNR